MNGFTRKLTTLFVIAIVVTCFSSAAFAAYNSYTCKKTESKTYVELAGTHCSSAGYDYGTTLPFDDASATVQANGDGTNYVYLMLRFDTYQTYYNSFSKSGGQTARYQYVATGYDSMTGLVRAKNSDLNGVQLMITD